VFGPERAIIDDILNRSLLAPYGVKFWEVRSNPPRISDPAEITAAITAFEGVGAMTPNVAIGLANEQFGLNIPVIDHEWGNFPFTIVEALATSGKLIGFEKIMKEIEEAELDESGNPVQPGATPAAPATEEGEEGEGKEKADQPRQIRRALGDLRDILEEASRQRYNPPPRKRAVQATMDNGQVG
jgi:hypothetical protein